MITIELRKRDGYSSHRPWLRSLVRHMQVALAKAGHIVLDDGYFGNDTERALMNFQAENCPTADGVLDEPTWRALEPYWEEASGARRSMLRNVLPDFHGDLDWIHDQEGHRGRSYWPGGDSGVTLDPGVDLGYVEPDRLRNMFRGVMNDAQWPAVEKVMGVKGEAARDQLESDLVLQGIRMTRKQADEIFPFAIQTYWQGITDRFPMLREAETPGTVQTAMLSLAYNRGTNNPAFEALEKPLQAHEWEAAAAVIGNMQQDHPLKGVRTRRVYEAELIKAELTG